MTDCIDKDGFRANVGIILMNDDGLVFLAGRAGRPGWQFPQGGIYPEESPDEAMFRELTEEIGLAARDVELMGKTRRWLRYYLPRKFKRRGVESTCIGQKQRWYLLKLVGEEHNVRFDSTSEPEFDRWRWVDYWHPVREVIYFKRHVYARALDELRGLAFPEDPPPRPQWLSDKLLGRRRRSRNAPQA